MIGKQNLSGGICQPGNRTMILLGITGDKEVGQRNNLIRPLTQGRQFQMDGIDAVIKVLAEGSLLHHLFQILVGCADQPDINRD